MSIAKKSDPKSGFHSDSEAPSFRRKPESSARKQTSHPPKRDPARQMLDTGFRRYDARSRRTREWRAVSARAVRRSVRGLTKEAPQRPYLPLSSAAILPLGAQRKQTDEFQTFVLKRRARRAGHRGER